MKYDLLKRAMELADIKYERLCESKSIEKLLPVLKKEVAEFIRKREQYMSRTRKVRRWMYREIATAEKLVNDIEAALPRVRKEEGKKELEAHLPKQLRITSELLTHADAANAASWNIREVIFKNQDFFIKGEIN